MGVTIVRGVPHDVAECELYLQAQHVFVSRGKGTRGCGYREAPDQPECRAGRMAHMHIGAPPSLNAISPGSNGFLYHNWKQAWEEVLTAALEASGLPRPLKRVFVEAEATFHDRRTDRDQGNHRWMIEKALGDALERGGWLPERVRLAGQRLDVKAGDSWDHYEFGNLQRRYVKGVSATRLLLFPTAYEPGELEWWTEMPLVHDEDF